MRDTMVDTEVIKDAVWLACRAPSLHNSQPWRWVVEGNTVHLFVDKDRVTVRRPIQLGREALIGCGAVLDHFRVAMAAAGWTANVDRFPNPNNPRYIWRRSTSARWSSSPMDTVVAPTPCWRGAPIGCLSRRRQDWDSVEDELRGAVHADAVRLDVMPDELRPELAEASQLTESLRLYDSSYHAELHRWTSRSGRDRRHSAELA